MKYLDTQYRRLEKKQNEVWKYLQQYSFIYWSSKNKLNGNNKLFERGKGLFRHDFFLAVIYTQTGFAKNRLVIHYSLKEIAKIYVGFDLTVSIVKMQMRVLFWYILCYFFPSVFFYWGITRWLRKKSKFFIVPSEFEVICVLFEIVCTLQIDFSFLPTRRKETSKLGLSTTISQSLLRRCLSVENFQIQILINLVMPHYLQYTAIPQKRTNSKIRKY